MGQSNSLYVCNAESVTFGLHIESIAAAVTHAAELQARADLFRVVEKSICRHNPARGCIVVMAGLVPATTFRSSPGLTRRSSRFARRFFAKRLDPRVKPAGDGLDPMPGTADKFTQSAQA